MGVSGGDPVDYFQHFVGHFWSAHEPRDYCRTRLELASCISYMAYWHEFRPLCEEILTHHLELLRLTISDNQGVRNKTPFVLLTLNRDLDCYHFIKWWSQSELYEEMEPWQEGQWPYSVVGGVLTEDLFEILNSLNPHSFNLAHLAALALVKFRIWTALNVKQDQLKALENCGVLDVDTLENVQEMMFGVDMNVQDVLQEQNTHLEKYLGYIEARNPTLLPAIVNPEPMKQKPLPSSYRLGSPAEAYVVMNDCRRHFARVPNALKRIEDFVGRGPHLTYDITES